MRRIAHMDLDMMELDKRRHGLCKSCLSILKMSSKATEQSRSMAELDIPSPFLRTKSELAKSVAEQNLFPFVK